MNLIQAKEFSRLSGTQTDGCTFALELGVSEYCDMHDRLLVQLYSRELPPNILQRRLLQKERYGVNYTLTRKECDILFRDGLQEKIENEPWYKKPGYWVIKWVYYSAVRLLSKSLKFKGAI